MHPELTEEHEALRRVVREFVEAEIEPHAEAWDRDHTFPVDTVLAMGELGLFGIPFPEPYGGGGDLTGLCVAIEEIARADQSLAITLEAGVGLGASPIYKFGTPAQQDAWLPDLCAGRALGGFGLTEPDAGSDAGGTRTKARLEDEQWVIDGEKSFITNSGTPITSLVTVTALTGPGEISTIVVPAGTPGFEVQPPYRKMGWHASDTHGLTFVECRVPADQPARPAWDAASPSSSRSSTRAASPSPPWPSASSSAASTTPSPTPASATRSGGRSAPTRASRSGAPTCTSPSPRPAASCTTRRGSATTGAPFKTEAATAKLFATEAAIDATRSATQVFGGYGFMDETAVSRHYRDAKILEIGEGTSEVQRMVIGRALGLRV